MVRVDKRGVVQPRRGCGVPSVLGRRSKTLLPGQFSCPEQIQEKGVPAQLRCVGNDAVAQVDDFVAGKLGM